MSKKVDVSLVAEVLQNNKLEPAVLRRIIEELISRTTAEEDGEEKPPAEKKQCVVLASDPEGKLTNYDFVAWVMQIPETESPATVKDRIYRSVYEFNTTKRGRLLPVKTVGEALENVPAKHFKEQDLFVKTKEPVLVIVTDNKIPVVEVE